MFVNKNKMMLMNFLGVVLLLIGIFMAFIGIVGCFLPFSNSDATFSGYLPIFLPFTSIGLIMLWFGISRFSLSGKANRFNSVFMGDSDGVIDIEFAAKAMGQTEEQVVQCFNDLVMKGYLINCSLDCGNKMRIVLNNGAKNANSRFDIVYCRNCGAPSSVKQGFVEKCPYCGSKLEKPTFR